MKIDEFELSISYAQFGLFDSSTEQPFNEWSSRHIAQAFSWRPESVFFHTPFGDELHKFEIVLDTVRPALDRFAQRAIVVPFPRMTTEELEFGSIGVAHILHKNFERNSILVQFVSNLTAPLVRVHFYHEAEPLFAIITADSDEMKSVVLETTARPA